ncbi:MAG: YcjF family protein [Hyphomicrobiales bacterium]|nr:YcjF family protein [Hyphomicrobiales bacterium]
MAVTAPMGEVIEKTQASAVPVKATSTRGARTFAESNLAKRQARARAIVARYAAYSAVGGIVPLPVASVAGITTIIIRMVKMLSDLYGVPFERDRARAIIVGLVGGTVPTGFATVTTSTLFFVVPSGALMGLVVSSITAVACTRSIGQIFIEHFESGATLHDLSIKES